MFTKDLMRHGVLVSKVQQNRYLVVSLYLIILFSSIIVAKSGDFSLASCVVTLLDGAACVPPRGNWIACC